MRKDPYSVERAGRKMQLTCLTFKTERTEKDENLSHLLLVLMDSQKRWIFHFLKDSKIMGAHRKHLCENISSLLFTF